MIYLDYNATGPLDPRALEAMLPFLRDRFGNAASRHHSLGQEAQEAVEKARAQVASLMGAEPGEIVWTSGATESNNLAILGVAASPAYALRGREVVTVATEHRAVLDACEHLESKGYRVSYLGVDREGMLDLERLERAITERTILVSVMHANNETGVLQPIREIGALCKRKKVLFHTDASQSFGKEKIDVQSFGIDLLSASAHKMGGPKGVGLLYVRKRNPRVRVEPLLHGGGHEKGLRSGTLNVPAIVGMGAAAELSVREGPAEQERFRALRGRLESGIRSKIDGVLVNGHPTRRLSQTTNLSFMGLSSEELMKHMPEVAVSSSSACTSARLQPSYVLAALGCDEARIRASLRFSLGRFTTQDEIDLAIEAVARAVLSIGKAPLRGTASRGFPG